MERSEIKRKPLESYGKVCIHGSVPALGHDCEYTSARNRLIPAAEQLARKRVPKSIDGSINLALLSQEFLKAMDELWKGRHASDAS